MSLPPTGFVKPSHPVKKRKDDPPKLGTISEDKQGLKLEDPMALDKDGYVDKNMMAQTQNSLSHFSYMCPGLHGGESKQDISRSTFHQLLTDHPRFVIPIFQRRYCWKKEQVDRWYRDTRRGTRDPMGSHNTGNLIITRSSLASDSYLLVDGQQRVTTTLIFLAAIRDTLLNMNIVDKKLIQEKADIITKLNSYILVETAESKESKGSALSSVDAFQSKLTPCYLDRKSFTDIIMSNEEQIMTEDNGIMTKKTNESSSYQAKAYNTFVESMVEELEKIDNPMDRLDLVQEIFRQALDKMSVTRCKIEGNIDPAQIFLWLQEKSFFNGYMLQNLRPGEFLLTVDLARNLVLAPLLKLSPDLQDLVYLDHWLARLEKLFPTQEDFNAAVIKYIDHKKDDVKTMSEFETMFTKMHKQLAGGDRFLGLLQYSKFVSIYESIQEQVARGSLAPGSQEQVARGSGRDDNQLPEEMLASSDLRTSLCVIDSMQIFFQSL